MRISHKGSKVLIGDLAVGPGVAESMATIIEGKRDLGEPVLIGHAGRVIRFTPAGLTKAAAALRRHAAASRVVRGPVSSGPIGGEGDASGRLDEILGRLTGLYRKARKR